MNERIKELMNQAAKQYYADTGEIKPNDMMYIFAELIVRECADLFDKDEMELTLTERTIHNTIKEHFGVEE